MLISDVPINIALLTYFRSIVRCARLNLVTFCEGNCTVFTRDSRMLRAS